MESVITYLSVTTFVYLQTQDQVTAQGSGFKCLDESSFYQCYSWYVYGYCDSHEYYDAMKKRCQRTCGLCDMNQATTSPPRDSAAGDLKKNVCKNKNKDCAYYKEQNYCVENNRYFSFMKSNCALMCGFCQPEPVCKNINANCDTWKTYCTPTSVYWKYMKKNCKKTCKICKDKDVEDKERSGKKHFTCDFEKDFCQWINQPFDDAIDWKLGTIARGPTSGADDSAKYIYVDTPYSAFKARLLLPLELVLPDGVASKGKMCMKFKFLTGSGRIKVIEERYPTLKRKYPDPRTLVNLQGSGSWVEALVQVTVDNKRQIVLEGETGARGVVAVDSMEFIEGRC